jgi:hypothetical protein
LRVKLPGASEDQIRAANEAVVLEVTRDGRRWISNTIVDGRSVIRVMVISYLTGYRQLEDLAIALTEGVSSATPIPRSGRGHRIAAKD